MIKTAWQLKDRYHLSAADHRVHQVLREGLCRLTEEQNKTVSDRYDRSILTCQQRV